MQFRLLNKQLMPIIYQKPPWGTIPEKESLSFGLYYDIIYDKLMP
jgi:hypothetical protein